MEEVMARGYCPMTPLEHKCFFPLKSCRLLLISGFLRKERKNGDVKPCLQQYFINREVFAQGLCVGN